MKYVLKKKHQAEVIVIKKMRENKMSNNIVTVALYRSDLKELDNMFDNLDSYKEKVHELVLKEVNNGR